MSLSRCLLPTDHGLFLLLFVLAMAFTTLPLVSCFLQRTEERAALTGCERLAIALAPDPASIRSIEPAVDVQIHWRAHGMRAVTLRSLRRDGDGHLQTVPVHCVFDSAGPQAGPPRLFVGGAPLDRDAVESTWTRIDAGQAPS